MVTTTLNKFGVPGQFETGRGGILQPKLKYRFRIVTVAFGPINNQIDLTQQVMNITKPQLTFDEVMIDSIIPKLGLLVNMFGIRLHW